MSNPESTSETHTPKPPNRGSALVEPANTGGRKKGHCQMKIFEKTPFPDPENAMKIPDRAHFALGGFPFTIFLDFSVSDLVGDSISSLIFWVWRWCPT